MTGRRLLPHMSLWGLAGILLLCVVTFVYYDWHQSHARRGETDARSEQPAPQLSATPVRVSVEARKNLGVVSSPVHTTTYIRTIDIPGLVTDRPGVSDRGVVAPVTGIVTRIHAYPGNTVTAEAPLFTLRLVSESLHNSQLELFRATKEIEILRQQRQRLEGLTQKGGVAGSRIIEIENQIERMGVNVQAFRQELLARGLSLEHIDAATRGEFVTEITVRAPDEQLPKFAEIQLMSTTEDPSNAPIRTPFNFELQSLRVALGQQVDAGELLCNLADHRNLLIEGRAFRKDMALIQRAAKDGLAVGVNLEMNDESEWPPVELQLRIEHVANLVDASSRTFSFYLSLDNECQVYNREGRNRLIWRYHPGDRVQLSVSVDEVPDVFVLPQSGLVRDGSEAFVFRQNGDLFDRIGVHLLYEDRTSVVIANDGKLRKGWYIAQNAAASLNRVRQAQIASGQPTNLHVHADGTTHEAH